MALFLRTCRSDMKSNFGTFQWPTEVGATVEAPDWDSTPKCGHGLHGLKDGRGAVDLLDWDLTDRVWVLFESDTFVELPNGCCKVPKATIRYVGSLEGAITVLTADKVSVRDWIVADPEWAYSFARFVDKGPQKDTRKAACKDPEWAYEYALRVDKKARADTRKAVLCSPEHAYLYAMYVDRKARDDTRAAACKNPAYAYHYALWVDQSPRDDTRQAACSEPVLAGSYALNVDEGWCSMTWNVVQGSACENVYTRILDNGWVVDSLTGSGSL